MILIADLRESGWGSSDDVATRSAEAGSAGIRRIPVQDRPTSQDSRERWPDVTERLAHKQRARFTDSIRQR
jgi:hypothetical protein